MEVVIELVTGLGLGAVCFILLIALCVGLAKTAEFLFNIGKKK